MRRKPPFDSLNMAASDLLEVVREFVSDIEQVGLDQTQEDWPDLVVTYEHAKNALRKVDGK